MTQNGKEKERGVPGVRPSITPGDEAVGRPPLGGHVFRPRNVASLLLALVFLFLVSRQLLGVDGGEVWASIREANGWLFALAFLIFYCSYPLRALRWKRLLNNIGYGGVAGQPTGQPIPSVSGLTRIMYLAWFANCVTVA